MERMPKPRSIVGAVLIGLVLFCLASALGLLAFVTLASTVSGTASLPNGTTATISGPFSCQERPRTTEIDAGGHTFAFSPTTFSIDGIAVGPLDANADVAIDVSYWSVSVRINGSATTLGRKY